MARLVTTHLMERAGYGVGRYISVEQLVDEHRSEYHAALAAWRR